MVLLRSFFVGLLDAAERVLPALTPATLADASPAMRPNRTLCSSSSHDAPCGRDTTPAPQATRPWQRGARRVAAVRPRRVAGAAGVVAASSSGSMETTR